MLEIYEAYAEAFFRTFRYSKASIYQTYFMCGPGIEQEFTLDDVNFYENIFESVWYGEE